MVVAAESDVGSVAVTEFERLVFADGEGDGAADARIALGGQ